MNDKTAIFITVFNALMERSKLRAQAYDKKEWQKNVLVTLEETFVIADSINERLNPVMANPEDEIYCGDYVILSIEKKEPEKFIIKKIPNFIGQNIVTPTELGENGNISYRYINAYSDLGMKIIGKHVGDSLSYNEDDVDSFIFKILSHTRTAFSTKINEYELRSEIQNIGQRNKR